MYIKSRSLHDFDVILSMLGYSSIIINEVFDIIPQEVRNHTLQIDNILYLYKIQLQEELEEYKTGVGD